MSMSLMAALGGATLVLAQKDGAGDASSGQNADQRWSPRLTAERDPVGSQRC
jgi:hypothetical protein